MEYVNLIDIIDCLTERTNLNICILFFDNHGNSKTALPHKNRIHGKPYCDFVKSTANGYEKCFKCRNLAIKKAKEGKIPFSGFCFNGVYEYCHPIVDKDVTIAVIMVGNIILTENTINNQQISLFDETFEKDFPTEKCQTICKILDTYIRILIKEFSENSDKYNPLLKNIYAYIDEFIFNDMSVQQISESFGYSAKHIGRVFKAKTGITIHEYINDERLEKAKMLLRDTNYSITDVSSKSGFNNLTYFNRIFKKKFGLTPREFRKQTSNT